MPTFKYIAKKGPEEKTEGTIQAESKNNAIDKLHTMGLVPIRIEEKTFVEKGKSKRFKFLFGRVSWRDITIFSRQLATLIKSGVTLLNSLEILCQQVENPYLKDIVNDIKEKVKSGDSLSSAMRYYPRIFPVLYTSMIEVGENSGTLQQVLLKISDFYQRQEEVQSKIRTASVYPLLILAIGALTIFFILTYVVPRLTKMFVQTGQELPVPTVILITISSWITQYWFWIILVVALAYFFLKRSSKSKVERVIFSALKLHLPLFGHFFMKAELGIFTRTLQLLLESGVHLLRAMALSIPVINNEIIKKELVLVIKDIEKGDSLGKSLKKSNLFPVFMINLSIIGEESGRLDNTMGEIATYYERDTDEMLKTVISLIEPIMILIVGSLVGLMVIAMLLPIFQMSFNVR